jgi:hypothetical protein
MYDPLTSESRKRNATVLVAFAAAGLLAFVATSASSARISPGFTSAYNHAQLAYRQLGLFAPVDMQAGHPFFAPINAGIAITTPQPGRVPAPASSSSFATFLGDSRSYSGIPREVLPKDTPVDAIPEPAGALLFGAGFALVALRTRRA